jgi:tRNA(His) 5'-end guanylyltransferase
MVGQAYFSQNELDEKTCSNIQDMLMEKYKINWNDYPTYQKRGACVVRNEIILEKRKNGTVLATQRDFSQPAHAWIIDKNIPQFKGEGREYIEKLIHFKEG